MKKIISFALLLTLALTLCLVGCDQSTGEVADNTEHLTKITNQCKLTKDYADKSFLTDGIGEASVAKYTDGDTFTALLKKENTTVVIRFHSVDTPESTGGIEKWGKAASNFVKDQLSKATEVVLEATATPAEKDSYGSRYLGYVWYRTGSSEDFKNLNLELVENGYSENKGVDTSKYPYNSYFKSAEENARAIKLRLFSKKDDPLFSDKPIDVTLKEILTDPEDPTATINPLYYNAEVDSGSKVRFYACLVSLEKSKGSSPTTTFKAVTYDKETGETYEIDVYAGYSSSTATTMPLGHYYRIVGTIASHYGNIQISGITYDTIYGEMRDDYTHPVQKNYYLTFDTAIDYINNYSATLYSDAIVISSSVEDGVLTILAKAYKNGKDDNYATEATEFTFKVAVSEDYENVFTEGVNFAVRGYQFENGSGIIDVINYSDITVRG